MSKLLDRIVQDAIASGKKKAIIQAGHFPLVYSEQTRTLTEGVFAWGEFTPYTFGLGCAAAAALEQKGISTKIAIICDDHTQQQEYNLLRGQQPDLPQWRLQRNKFYRNASGENAKIHPLFESLLEQHGLRKEQLIRHDHGKAGRHDCAYFSESVLRAGTGNLTNACSREYEQFLNNHVPQDTYLIGFVPERCHHFIQDALMLQHKGEQTHIYLPTPLIDTKAKVIIDQRSEQGYTSKEQEVHL